MKIPKPNPEDVAARAGWDTGTHDVCNGVVEEEVTIPKRFCYPLNIRIAYRYAYELATEGYRD